MNRTALITGASRGLGLALARRLAQDGWQLIVTARNADKLEMARAEFAAHTTVSAVAGDVSDPQHQTALVEAATQHGGLDALVNNAGILGPSSGQPQQDWKPQPALLEYPIPELERVYRINTLAPLALIQRLAAQLKPGARILNISSDAAVAGYAGWGGYGSSKAALEALGRSLAAENPEWRVYSVDPGDMNTEMHQEAFPGEDISNRANPTDSVQGLLRLLEGDHPSGRYAARDLAQPAAQERP